MTGCRRIKSGKSYSDSAKSTLNKLTILQAINNLKSDIEALKQRYVAIDFGKVKTGQEVLVKFSSYPFQEFGIVAGGIESVAEMSKGTAYMVRVSFPKRLMISSQKTIHFRNGLTASGEIVAENLNLIERLFYEIRS